MNILNLMNKFLFILIVVLICGCSSDPFPEIELPVYQNSKNIHRAINKPAKGVKTVFYSNAISFPSKDLIAFYDREFDKIGCVPFSEDGYGLRRWEYFNPKSGEWEPTSKYPARYISTWTDASKSLRIILSMSYEYVPNRQDETGRLLVNCTVSPFFDSRNIEPPEFPE